MKRADIADRDVVALAAAWREGGPGVVTSLVERGVPEKVALRKIEHMVDRDLLDYGTSPYFAWPTDAGTALL